MGQIAFVFSGQGDQYPGMGRELYEKSEAARKIFDLCESLRPGTLHQCFQGTEEELKQTENTQPCLFVLELAAVRALAEKGGSPDAAAGFSLGEVAAATACGLFSLEDGFSLVCRRGALMQREAEKFDTAMAAVVKLTPKTVETLCAHYPRLYPVNYNCPGQITVSGLAESLPAFSAEVKAAGGRCLPLKVKGAFHSPFMQKAAEEFREALGRVEIRKADCPLYSNVTGQVYGEDPADLLARQIASPVQWEKTIRNLIAAGVDTFVEIGPGKTLTNMIRKIDPQVNALPFANYLEETPC